MKTSQYTQHMVILQKTSEYLPAVGCRRSSKFISVRGGRAVLFEADLWLKYPLLLLVEGEWDAMLAYQAASGLCDVASLGSATRRAALPDLSMLSGYPRVLAVYDDDLAGDKARKWVGSIARVHCVPLPPMISAITSGPITTSSCAIGSSPPSPPTSPL